MSARFNVLSLLAPAMLAGALALPAYAQYSGPSTIKEGTVAGILANPVDDQAVQLQGHLLRRTANDKYIFSDGTGEIVAEIKDKRFPAQPVDEKTKVELVGEVDTGLTRPPEIEVDSMRVVQ
ncbi:NirD/YgiW/YdeI family stress tolerance protein [Pollutimonas sp. H1-120]|uniref:YgiW/YdeI family stress tolerance OB fold protein n=1 Tax=Pollutimonas sp. H1-120 TaxID=3148824 RepID=UPI003B52488C